MLFGKKSPRDVDFLDIKKLVVELKEPESVLLDYKSGVDLYHKDFCRRLGASDPVQKIVP